MICNFWAAFEDSVAVLSNRNLENLSHPLPIANVGFLIFPFDVSHWCIIPVHSLATFIPFSLNTYLKLQSHIGLKQILSEVLIETSFPLREIIGKYSFVLNGCSSCICDKNSKGYPFYFFFTCKYFPLGTSLQRSVEYRYRDFKTCFYQVAFPLLITVLVCSLWHYYFSFLCLKWKSRITYTFFFFLLWFWFKFTMKEYLNTNHILKFKVHLL